MKALTALLMVVICAACGARRSTGAPVPDPASPLPRTLVGCYELPEGRRVYLDSVAQTGTSLAGPGVRRALFAPDAPIVYGYWFVTRARRIWVVRHDGLWGRSWELEARGDSLVGTHYLHSDMGWELRRPAAAVREPCPAGDR